MALIRGSQVINCASAGVRTAEEGAVHGYAQQKKAQCVGTQRDRRFRCGGTAKIRGATEAASAELQ